MNAIQSSSASDVRTQEASWGTESAAAPSGGRSLTFLPPVADASPHAMLAALQVKNLKEQEKTDELSRDAAEVAENAADNARIDEMKKKATESFILGLVGGGLTIASGACNVMSGAKTIEGAGKVGAAAKVADGRASEWRGTAEIMSGSAGVLNEVKNFNAANKDVHVAEYERASKVAHRAAERFSHEVDARAQAEAKVQQLLGEIQQAEEQCRRAALLRA